jgi:hypothetical protein
MFEICPDLSKKALKHTIFVNIKKRPKNGQMAKPFYFWQTVSKRPNGNPANSFHDKNYKFSGRMVFDVKYF